MVDESAGSRAGTRLDGRADIGKSNIKKGRQPRDENITGIIDGDACKSDTSWTVIFGSLDSRYPRCRKLLHPYSLISLTLSSLTKGSQGWFQPSTSSNTEGTAAPNVDPTRQSITSELRGIKFAREATLHDWAGPKFL